MAKAPPRRRARKTAKRPPDAAKTPRAAAKTPRARTDQAAKKPRTRAHRAASAPRREVIHVPGGRPHKNPVPACIRMGNLVFSASIAGQDPATDAASADPAAQIALAFANLRQTIAAAGGTPANIARINFYVPDMSVRAHINREWLAMFPDENDRPVRKVYPGEIPDGLYLQLDFIAVL